MKVIGESASSQPSVLVRRHDGVLIATLNRPRVHNAVDHAVAEALGLALEDADQDPDVRAIVVTGAGDAAFCAGADLKAIGRGEGHHPDPRVAAWGFAGFVRHPVDTPVIAAVNGLAYGGGTEIVLASDLAVASEAATFALPEVTRGIIASAGGAFRLPRSVPPKIAMEMLLVGDPITAARAYELGLVNRVVPPHLVLDTALDLAFRICANAPLAVRASKRLAAGITDGDVPHERPHWDHTATEGERVRRSADAREGPRAFAERRPPQWRGR